MVDALREANRVLVPGGTMLDLRPLAETSPLYVAESTLVGELDTTGLSADDEAADAAIVRALRAEWFARRAVDRFSIEFRWSAIAEFGGYVSGGRQPKRVRPDLDELLRHPRAAAGLRTRRAMTLGVYQKPARRFTRRPGTGS